VPQEVRAQFSLSYRSADSGTQLFIGLIPEALMMSKIFTVESKVMHHAAGRDGQQNDPELVSRAVTPLHARLPRFVCRPRRRW